MYIYNYFIILLGVYIVGKSGFISHTKHTAVATNTDLLQSLKIKCKLEF